MNLGIAGSGVLVTGASGAIGAATARAFADEGAQVAVHYHRNGDAPQELADEIGGVALRADLTSQTETAGLVAAARHQLGGLDVCVATQASGQEPRHRCGSSTSTAGGPLSTGTLRLRS